MQKHLLYITKLNADRELKSKIFRGIMAEWREEDHTACIDYYFDGSITDEDAEIASDISTGVISHFPDGMLEENFIR